jgi:hypothetical protein
VGGEGDLREMSSSGFSAPVFRFFMFTARVGNLPLEGSNFLVVGWQFFHDLGLDVGVRPSVVGLGVLGCLTFWLSSRKYSTFSVSGLSAARRTGDLRVGENTNGMEYTDPP